MRKQAPPIQQPIFCASPLNTKDADQHRAEKGSDPARDRATENKDDPALFLIKVMPQRSKEFCCL